MAFIFGLRSFFLNDLLRLFFLFLPLTMRRVGWDGHKTDCREAKAFQQSERVKHF